MNLPQPAPGPRAFSSRVYRCSASTATAANLGYGVESENLCHLRWPKPTSAIRRRLALGSCSEEPYGRCVLLRARLVLVPGPRERPETLAHLHPASRRDRIDTAETAPNVKGANTGLRGNPASRVATGRGQYRKPSGSDLRLRRTSSPTSPEGSAA